MAERLSADQLAELQQYSSCSIANAIETFNVRPRNMGFMSFDIKCMFPEMPPMVGYAFTARIRASFEAKQTPDIWTYRKAVLAAPGPKIMVIEDEDDIPVGSYWGEVNGSIHKALGCVGTITNGGVRDLNEARAMGFHFFARTVLVSHAYVHLREWGIPINIAGLLVRPGDLLHADQHGIVQIPHEIAPNVAAATAEVERKERIVINAARDPNFSIEKLQAAFQEMRGY